MKVAIGQDSHKIDYNNTGKKLILGGIEFDENLSIKYVNTAYSRNNKIYNSFNVSF